MELSEKFAGARKNTKQRRNDIEKMIKSIVIGLHKTKPGEFILVLNG
jgi:hypothetical protein